MRANILATLAYYDVLDFPLKAEEVLKYLIRLDPRSLSFYHDRGNLIVSQEDRNLAQNQAQDQTQVTAAIAEVKKSLDQLVLDKLIDFDQGYYFLFGRDYLVPLRLKRARISRKKWAKASRAIWWLQFIPYVEAVFASGSLALNNCDELSDLDVLVVTRKGRIWLTRFWITAWLSIIGVRRKPFDKIAPDKICLNHYITDQSLKIPFESLYNAQNYINLKPLLIRQTGIFEKFYRENPWLADYLCHYDMMIYHRVEGKVEGKRVEIGFFSRLVAGFFRLILDSEFGDWLEARAKNYQVKKISRNPLTRAVSGHVIYNDNQLAFHPDSPEKELLGKYKQLLTNIKIER